MDKFLTLPEEKQKKIRDASLLIFGSRGYRKASIQDIADKAGTSKATIFHYFGTKQDLYMYLVDYSRSILSDCMSSAMRADVNDLFERLVLIAKAKASVCRICPYIFRFITCVINEHDAEVSDQLQQVYLSDSLYTLILKDADCSKFREEIDAHSVQMMIRWLTEGYFNDLYGSTGEQDEKSRKIFFESLDLIRRSVYRPEYLASPLGGV